MGQERKAYRLFVGKGDMPLRRHRYIWEDNIKTDLRELG
jgi:hypothetical protein